MDFREHVKRAITICGSQKALAEKIGLSQPGVSWLINEATQISAELSVAIERATDGQITRIDLRPDLFAPPSAERTAAAPSPEAA